MRILGRLASQFGSDTDFFAFGASETELRDHQIPRYDGVEILGKLSQPEVAELLQQSDFFLDLSDYQAFGRTAAEAMACGAIVLAPSLGGTSDFIKHAVNSFLVDTTDEAAILDEVQRMLALSAPERLQIGFAAVEAVDGFTPTAAAVSELRVLLGV
jgi:glycosyltransferase involved in cell wall biosynthesis